MNLYQLSESVNAKMIALGNLLENGETPTDEQVNELIDLQGDLENKLVGYGFVVKNINADIDALDIEIARLNKLKKSKKNQVELLKSRMQMAMIDNDIAKVNDAILPISIRNNAPSVRLDIDPIHLPAKFVKITYEADKIALKEALKAGQEIKGVSLEVKQSIKIG